MRSPNPLLLLSRSAAEAYAFRSFSAMTRSQSCCIRPGRFLDRCRSRCARSATGLPFAPLADCALLLQEVVDFLVDSWDVEGLYT